MARTVELIEALLRSQDGVATRRQITDVGPSLRTIERYVNVGTLIAFPNGVVGLNAPDDEYRQWIRATLLGHDDSVLGFETAAHLHGLPVKKPPVLDLVVPHGHNPDTRLLRERNIRVHQTRRLNPVDHSVRDGLAVTSPARTLVDLATSTSRRRLRWLFETAINEHIVAATAIEAAANSFRRSGRRGIGIVFEVLDELVNPEPIANADSEALFRRLVRSTELSGVIEQYTPPWFDGIRGIVDFAIPKLKIIIEVDGRRWHSLTQNMENDRRRDRLAMAHGWIVIRFTWAELKHRPADVLASLGDVINSRSQTVS